MSDIKHWLVLDPHPDAETFVVWDVEAADEYRRARGYRVDGPFVPAERMREATTRLEALKARLRQEVDARRMTLHDRALPFTDEEWQGYLAGIPGFGE